MNTVQSLTVLHRSDLPSAMHSLTEIAPLIKKNGFERFGATPLTKPFSIDAYKKWLGSGFHGDMDYMEQHLPQKENPQKINSRIRSAIVVAQAYLPHPRPAQSFAASQLRTALYAQGEDYHLWLKQKLNLLVADLKEQNPDQEFLCFTDSAPVLERELAYLSGLGWVGKNTCVIHPQHGSLWFIGEIYTSLALQNESNPIADFCGTCDRCIRACPTGAIENAKVLNATKCISYWNIEAKSVAPEPLRKLIGDWFFGCDICQTVCPWNEKAFGKTKMQALSGPSTPDRPALVSELRFILSSSNHKLMDYFHGAPQQRARGRGLKRNALIVIANLKLQELHEDVSRIENAELLALKNWTLEQLK